MTRKTDIRRDTNPQSPKLFTGQKQKAELEAQNGLLQFDEIVRIISEIEQGTKFRLRPSMIQSLHRIAIQDIYICAGTYRNHEIQINGTDHQHPEWQNISPLVEDLCDYVNDHWDSTTPIHLSSYVMWRINWIHPFAGGNGRTSRAVSYVVLCSKLGYRLPGTLTIPDQIIKNRKPYYAALDAADHAWQNNNLDVLLMEELLSTLLARQLSNIHRAATQS